MSGDTITERAMNYLSLVHKLDRDTCLQVEPDEATDSPRIHESNYLSGLGSNLNQLENKFVRKGGTAAFFTASKRAQNHLQKLVHHSNGCLVEPGGREVRLIEANPRFNYKQSIAEGEYHLNFEEQKLLAMQPMTYSVYNMNLA